ncbi:hypothetical protein CVT26_007300, partial [Gymnopilus dilepis]
DLRSSYPRHSAASSHSRALGDPFSPHRWDSKVRFLTHEPECCCFLLKDLARTLFGLRELQCIAASRLNALVDSIFGRRSSKNVVSFRWVCPSNFTGDHGISQESRWYAKTLGILGLEKMMWGPSRSPSDGRTMSCSDRSTRTMLVAAMYDLSTDAAQRPSTSRSSFKVKEIERSRGQHRGSQPQFMIEARWLPDVSTVLQSLECSSTLAVLRPSTAQDTTWSS